LDVTDAIWQFDNAMCWNEAMICIGPKLYGGISYPIANRKFFNAFANSIDRASGF